MVVNSLGNLSFPELLHNIGQPGSRCLPVTVIRCMLTLRRLDVKTYKVVSFENVFIHGS